MDPIFIFLFQIAVLLFSVIIHEISHGAVALGLGDETAKNAGRLTLNPVSHIDPIGSIAVPILVFLSSGGQFLFGWAKPVPYSPHLLHKDYKYGPLKVALAGPLSNLALAVVFGLIIRFTAGAINDTAIQLLAYIVQINLLLFVFNLIPIPPLDGSKLLMLFLPPRQAMRFQMFGAGNIFLLLLVIFFFSGFIPPIVNFLFNLIVGAA